VDECTRYLSTKRLGHPPIIAHDMGLIFGFLALITLVPFIVLIIYQEPVYLHNFRVGYLQQAMSDSGLVISLLQAQ
jgi:hypothetical protein